MSFSFLPGAPTLVTVFLTAAATGYLTYLIHLYMDFKASVTALRFEIDGHLNVVSEGLKRVNSSGDGVIGVNFDDGAYENAKTTGVISRIDGDCAKKIYQFYLAIKVMNTYFEKEGNFDTIYLKNLSTVFENAIEILDYLEEVERKSLRFFLKSFLPLRHEEIEYTSEDVVDTFNDNLDQVELSVEIDDESSRKKANVEGLDED